MKNRLVKLSAFILSAILFYGCQVDVNSSDTDNSKKASQAQGGAGIQGKAIYSNAEDSSTIQVILDKTDGLLSQTVIDAANGQINISSNVVSPDRTVVSYQCCAADGSYSFSNLEEGTYTVYASSPDSTEKAVYKSVVVKDNEVTIVPEITLTATGALSGKITLDGSENDNAGFIVFAGGTNFMAATAPDGSFTIAGLPAKTIYQIVVMRGAYTYMWKTSVQAEPLGNIDIGELDLLSTQISLTGKDGKDGKDGKNGKDGTNGTNGTPGTKGADGTNGTNGTNGKDGISIIWKGSFEDSSDIANPQYLWAFYNTTDNCSYIYDGQSWTLLAGTTQNASESSNAKVMISYELDRGTLPEGAPKIHTYGTITQLLPPTRPGYYFEGYYLDNNFTGEPVTRLGNDYVIGQTLYAKWTLNYTINYTGLDRNNSDQLIDYTYEQIMTLTFESFERNGYVLSGWKYRDEEQTEHIFQADDSLNLLIDYFIIQSGRRKTIVLNAIWTPIVYTITYNCGEATNNPDNPSTYTANNSVQIKDGTYNNYEYGWVIHGTNESCTGWTFEEQFGDIILDIDIAYRITYVLGGGTNNEQNPLKYKENQAVTLYTPTREGYTFTGWYLDEACEVSPITGWNEGEKNEHLTIYAGWTNPIIQSILAMTESGTITLTGNYNSDDIASLRKAMTKLYARAPEIMITLDLTDMKIKYSDLIFTGIPNIEGVILPHILTIPEFAFQQCCNLTNVTIPSGVTSISRWAFFDTKIKRIIIPSSVTKIYSNAIESPCLSTIYVGSQTCYNRILSDEEEYWYPSCFSYIYNAIAIEPEKDLILAKDNGSETWCITEYNISDTDLVLPESFNYDGDTYTEYGIGRELFKDHSEITSVTIPSSVVSIGMRAFEGCTGLTSLTIPNTVTWIGSGAFRGCTGLTSLTIPDTVTTVNENAFNGCTELTKVTIPPHVQFKSVFSDCPNITEVTINGDGTIADKLYKNCSNLNKVTICEGVTGIGDSAFENCTGLETVTFPATMSGGIGTSAFAGCTNLSNLTLPETMRGTIGISAFANCSELTSVIIPQGTSNLGESAFYKCTKLADVNLQGLSGRIDSYAFKLSGLKSITITAHISSIKEFAFSDCYNLINVFILKGVQGIRNNAFHNCTKLRAIFLPDSITSIGENILYNCQNLRYVEILLDYRKLSQSSMSMNNLVNYFLPDIYSHCYIYLSDNMITVGPANYLITYIDSPTIIQDGFIFDSDSNKLIAYSGDDTNITLPDSYTKDNTIITKYGLSSTLFSFYDYITSITIPSSVNQIDTWTFESPSITSITFNDPTGWASYINDSKYRDISPDELLYPATAAELLKGEFGPYILKKVSD